MNTNAIARHYDKLTPAERFPLILAAGERGDEAEQNRLANSGGRITLTMSDHLPFGHALHELALMTFIELLDNTADYLEVLQRADNSDFWADEPQSRNRGKRAVGRKGKPQAGRSRKLSGERLLEIAYASGFLLKAKMDGWLLFCERMTFPPYLLWEYLPGFERLHLALELTKDAAFKPAGMLAWLNSVRPEMEPEANESRLVTPEKFAAEAEALFRKRVEWWGG